MTQHAEHDPLATGRVGEAGDGPGAGRKPLGALQMKIFSYIASRRNRRTIVAVFEVKKEIRVSRSTYLYETGVLSGPTRRWWLPVDVEPVYLGQSTGSFSHYDPKNQTETVQFQPKMQ